MKRLISIVSLVALWPLAVSWAQVYAPNKAGVSMGQWYTIVKDVDATKKFWMVFGGKPIKIDDTEVMKFPGVLIFMKQGTPTGPSVGTAVNHVGFGVPDAAKELAAWKALGGKTSEVRNSPLNGQHTGDVVSPDELTVEFTEENGIAPYPQLPPNTLIESNHIHFGVLGSSRTEVQAWYVKMFGAIPGKLGDNLTGDIPGVKFLRWGNGKDMPLPTKGRALDHIGFEVKNLQEFCKKLEASGVKFDGPYSKSRHKSFASAELTDPMGVSIELTEGLNRF